MLETDLCLMHLQEAGDLSCKFSNEKVTFFYLIHSSPPAPSMCRYHVVNIDSIESTPLCLSLPSLWSTCSVALACCVLQKKQKLAASGFDREVQQAEGGEGSGV